MTAVSSPVPWQTEFVSADGRLRYELITPLEPEPAHAWGVRIISIDAAPSDDDAVALYGFRSADSARAWIDVHAAAADLADFPHLRMSQSLHVWSQRQVGDELPAGEPERVSEVLPLR